MSFAHVLITLIHVAIAELLNAMSMFLISDLNPFLLVFLPIIPSPIILVHPF